MSDKVSTQNWLASEETAPFYTVHGVIRYIDTEDLPGFLKDTVPPSSPVPVQDDSGRMIGAASLYMDGNKLMCHMAINYATPERLALETQSPPMYAYDWHSMKKDGKKWEIIKIELSSRKPERPQSRPQLGTVL